MNKYHCKKIELSKKYLEVATIENIIDTIKHGVMHVITNVEHNENCNHDKRFKENCKLYGYCGMSTKKKLIKGRIYNMKLLVGTVLLLMFIGLILLEIEIFWTLELESGISFLLSVLLLFMINIVFIYNLLCGLSFIIY